MEAGRAERARARSSATRSARPAPRSGSATPRPALCERVSQVVRPRHRRQPGDAGAAARHHRAGRRQRRRQEHADAAHHRPAAARPGPRRGPAGTTPGARRPSGTSATAPKSTPFTRKCRAGSSSRRWPGCAATPAPRRGADRSGAGAGRHGGPGRPPRCAATPRACGSASSWPRRCCTTRSCWSSTSRSAASTRRPGRVRRAVPRPGRRGKCLLVSSHELDELEKLTDHVAIMARGRIAAVGSVAQIRDRLDDHPLTVRVDVGPQADGDGAAARTGGASWRGRCCGCRTWSAWSWSTDEAGEEGVGRLLVRGRNPQRVLRGPDAAGAGGVVRGRVIWKRWTTPPRRCWGILLGRRVDSVAV